MTPGPSEHGGVAHARRRLRHCPPPSPPSPRSSHRRANTAEQPSRKHARLRAGPLARTPACLRTCLASSYMRPQGSSPPSWLPPTCVLTLSSAWTARLPAQPPVHPPACPAVRLPALPPAHALATRLPTSMPLPAPCATAPAAPPRLDYS